MKEKISITLSREVLNAIDRTAGSKKSRSTVIEAVLAQYLRKGARAQIEALDLEALNKAADELTPQIEDVLRYQIEGLVRRRLRHRSSVRVRANWPRSPVRCRA